jgi:hypothetical protein
MFCTIEGDVGRAVLWQKDAISVAPSGILAKTYNFSKCKGN